jgi:hypothetical protein
MAALLTDRPLSPRAVPAVAALSPAPASSERVCTGSFDPDEFQGL